jgi:hypothetical protein
MITNKITPKYLALYSIFKEYDNYTIDNNNLIVNANLQISYNLNDIEALIISTLSKLEDANNDEDISTEYKEALKEDYEEILEILNTIKEKIS